MTDDRRDWTHVNSIFDVIVVGGGSAGGVLADRLSAAGDRSLLLLEAGPDFDPVRSASPPEVLDADDSTSTDHDWGNTGSSTATGRRLPLYAGRLVGGSSATNNVMALRGDPSDYDAWAATTADRGWQFDALLPAFCRLERDLDFGRQDWHGTTGPIRIRRHGDGDPTSAHHSFLTACLAAGHDSVDDHNAPGAVGAGPLPLNEVDGVRQSTALTYLASARDRPNLTVRGGAQVDRVLIEGSRAVGVLLVDGTQLSAEQVVLCAGTLASPAVLMRSGVGPAERLRALGLDVVHDAPGVGRNLHDHPLLRLVFSTDAAASSPPRRSLLTLRSSDEIPAPDLQIFPSGPTSSDGSATLTVLVALLAPRSRGRLRLTTSDPTAHPEIATGQFDEAVDITTMAAGVEHAAEVIAGREFSEHVGAAAPDTRELLDATGPDLISRILAQVNTYHHPVGTCRMGPASDPESVVDGQGGVYGVTGLSVVDASIMPKIPSANTNVPTMMLAEHLSGRL